MAPCDRVISVTTRVAPGDGMAIEPTGSAAAATSGALRSATMEA